MEGSNMVRKFVLKNKKIAGGISAVVVASGIAIAFFIPKPDPDPNIYTQEQISHYRQVVQVIENNEISVVEPDNDPEYNREKDFGKAWLDVDGNGCDTRNDILKREISKYDASHSTTTLKFNDKKNCQVASGKLYDVYTGEDRDFERGVETSSQIQIDHIIALKDAWMSGAQEWSSQSDRESFANDPDNLIAADGPENGSKGDGFQNAKHSLWYPTKNPKYICDYIAHRVDLKKRFKLHFIYNEHEKSLTALQMCLDNKLPTY
jgi:hypothetical protein